MNVEKGSKVKVHYTGKLDDGKLFDKSKEDQPLEFTVGKQEVIPGFEQAVKSMEVGEEKTFTIDSENAYGPQNKELIKKVSRDNLPDELEPEEGMLLQSQNKAGQTRPVAIKEVYPDYVKIDFNHPLAGENLTFDIKVTDISS